MRVRRASESEKLLSNVNKRPMYGANKSRRRVAWERERGRSMHGALICHVGEIVLRVSSRANEALAARRARGVALRMGEQRRR